MEEFERRIDEASENPVALKQLADELLSMGGAYRVLGIKALARRAKLLNASATSDPPAQRAAQPAQMDWLTRLGLPQPDGRPLYRYKLSSAVFAQLQEHLAGRAPSMRQSPTRGEAALFVLWAAEWFRRCYRGGIQRWDDVGRPIGLRCDDWQGWKRLADWGLKFWSIPELRINGTHHRLAAIARQGGFPVAALEGGASGWAARYLKQLVGHLLADSNPTLDTADQHAERLIGSIPEIWRSEEMRVVSAELALEVVRLRRDAEAGGAISGSLVSAWLDQFRPGWRDELPLPVDGEAARTLMDDLLRVVPLKGGSGSVSVSRRLRIRDGKRFEIAALSLDGTIESPAVRSSLKILADQWSRLRLFASGVFGQYASGELAVAEPGDDDRWVARATAVRTHLEVPFSIPIQVELRGEGRRACDPFLMPGGDRVGDGLRVFAANSETEETDELILSGSGSGSYRAEPLYVGVPEGWSAEAHGDTSSCTIFHRSEEGREIWTVTGSARIISAEGDTYLIRAGQKGDKRDMLSLVGAAPRGCGNADPAVPLYLGLPRLEVSDGGRARSPAPGEAWWRRKGDTKWWSVPSVDIVGEVEFAWRDATTGHLRDRKDAVVLPADFKIQRSIGPGGTSLTIVGWAGQVRLDHGDRTGTATWRFGKNSKRHSTLVKLHGATGDVITLVVPLPHNASIDHWTDGPLSPSSTISLSTISRFVARSEGRCELLADLIDRQKRPVGQRRTSWWVDGELPLSVIRDDVAALLRPFGDIDAQVKLNFNDGVEDNWFVSEFEIELSLEARGLLPNKAIPDGGTAVVGRSLARPAKEREFCSYGLLDNLNHRPIELPKLAGDWLVYLRQDDRVISRPYFLVGMGAQAAPASGLEGAMAERSPFARDQALDRLCNQISIDPAGAASRATIRSIIDLALSLNGLPPATFDVFLKIDTHPLLGPLLLFQASPTELEVIIRLAEGLPFCWEAVPKQFWDVAAQVEFEALNRAMPDALQLCAEAISGRRREIAALEPALAPLLDLPTPPIGLREAVQSFLNRSGDRIPEHATNCFRPNFGNLPDWKVSDHFFRDLDAPVVAALAAKEAVNLNPEHVYCIKDVARRDPRYFREAFAAAFKEQCIG